LLEAAFEIRGPVGIWQRYEEAT